MQKQKKIYACLALLALVLISGSFGAPQSTIIPCGNVANIASFGRKSEQARKVVTRLCHDDGFDDDTGLTNGAAAEVHFCDVDWAVAVRSKGVEHRPVRHVENLIRRHMLPVPGLQQKDWNIGGNLRLGEPPLERDSDPVCT